MRAYHVCFYSDALSLVWSWFSQCQFVYAVYSYVWGCLHTHAHAHGEAGARCTYKQIYVYVCMYIYICIIYAY